MKKLALIAVAVAVIASGVWLARRHDPAAASAPGADRQALYWYDPMVPAQRFDKPGKSPFMDMQLVPKYADEGGEGSVSIDPRVTQNLGVRTAKVGRARLEQQLAAVGVVAVDERSLRVIESRASGWVERLQVRAASDPVRRGQVLAEVYAPDLLAAQEEFALALRMAGGRKDDALVAAGRRRLELLGVGAGQIARIEGGGAASRRVAYTAPADGIVVELGVREGQQVNPGMALFKLADLAQVWVLAQVPESQAAWIAAGQDVQVRVPSLPGKVFAGRVDYVYPELDRDTRTRQARIVLANPELALKPGMFAAVALSGPARDDVLTVPSAALIPTGERTVVIVTDGGGRFHPVEVRTGAEHGGVTEITRGLAEGDEIVVSGQFLIDSEASLRGALGRLSPDAPAMQPMQEHDAAAPAPEPAP